MRTPRRGLVRQRQRCADGPAQQLSKKIISWEERPARAADALTGHGGPSAWRCGRVKAVILSTREARGLEAAGPVRSTFVEAGFRPTQLCAGMRRRMDLGQLGNGDMSVDGGGLQAFMAQKCLDKADIGPVLQHLRRRRMPEQVTRSGLGNARACDMATDAL